METLNERQLQEALLLVCRRVVESEARLTEIDTIIGDGDHGIGMREGFTALAGLLENESFASPFALLRASGIQLLKTMGGASGVIFGTLFTGGHEAVQGKEALTAEDLAAFFAGGAAAIQKRGRSGPGDKTMLDALLPAVAAMEESSRNTPDVKALLHAAWQGAEDGVKASEQMLPRTGRSKNFREQALGYPDPGAVSVSIIFKGFYDSVSNL